MNGSKGVVPMTARERILLIRLLEKIAKYPSHAKALGIEVAGEPGAEEPDQ